MIIGDWGSWAGLEAMRSGRHFWSRMAPGFWTLKTSELWWLHHCWPHPELGSLSFSPQRVWHAAHQDTLGSEEKLLFNNGTLKVMRKPYNCVQLNITHNSLGFHSRACPIWVCKKDGEGMLKHIFLDPSSGAFCSLVLVWGLWFCISNKLLSDSEAVGPRTTFCVVLV